MITLDPTQSLPKDDAAETKRTPTDVVVSITSSFNLPGNSYIAPVIGRGSNWDRAVRDAVKQLYKHPKLRGRRARNIFPAKLTVQFDSYEEKDTNE